ncbi:MAG: hypothetical protein HN963_03180 [Thiotrichales bacterium]|jgi:hypothetical protein|nr:hypothetical protein [Thiotrichales bacterium]MBT7005913.1 hypothetical protein [Thiotrichales bacterium]MBT7314944.1 hypothetical protein [Thiotrichales bacterium]
MLSLNYEVEINKDHRVELTFPESLSLGKYQLVVVVDKAVNHHNDAQDDSEALMALARQVKGVGDIKDPVAWQREQRSEWDK